MKIVSTISAILILELFASTAAGQPPAQPPSATSRGLATTAMLHHLKLTGDPTLVADQVLLLELHQRGESPESSSELVHTQARTWATLKATGGALQIEGEAIVIGRALGRYSRELTGGGPVGVNPTRYLFAKLSRTPVPHAARRSIEPQQFGTNPTTMTLGDEIFGAVVAEFEDDPAFRAAWNELFFHRYGFGPGSGDADILNGYPEFGDHARLRALVNDQANRDAALEALAEATTEINDATAAMANITNAGRDVLAAATAVQAERRRRLNIANAFAVAEFSSRLLTRVAPAIGQPLIATTTAAFKVYDAVAQLQDVEASGGHMGLAQAVFSLNLVGTVVNLFSSLFGLGGPSPEEVILAELAKVRRQIEDLRVQLHHRFNLIHDHLESLHDNMLDGFEILHDGQQALHWNQLKIREFQNGMMDRLDQVYFDLRQLDADLAYLMGRILTMEPGDWLDHPRYAPCRRRYYPEAGDVITLTTYHDCMAPLTKLVFQLSKRQEPPTVPPTYTQAMVLLGLGERSLATMHALFVDRLRSLGAEAPIDPNSLSADVVSPQDWASLAAAIEDIRVNHPQHDPGDYIISYATTMRGYRAAVVRVHEAIITDLQAYPNKPSAIGTIIRDSSAALDRYQLEIDNEIDAYHGSTEFPGPRSASGDPEVRIEAGPYAGWTPLSQFDRNQLPGWIDYSPRPDACPRTMQVSGKAVGPYRGATVGYDWLFKRRNFGQLVNREDLVLARAGHGTVAVCVFYRDGRGRNVNRDLIGFHIYFVPAASSCEQDGPQLLRGLGGGFLDGNRATTDIARVFLAAHGHPPPRPQVAPRCRARYVDAFATREQALGDFVRRRLLSSATADGIERDLARFGALLRRMLYVLLDGSLEPTAQQLLTGEIGIPSPSRLLDDGPLPPWQVIDRSREQLEELQKALMSPALRQAIPTGPAITDTTYEYIDGPQ